MAAVTHGASVSFNQNTAATTITTPALTTTSANDLLLAFVSTDAVTTPNTTVRSVTGGGLTWALVVRTNTQSGTSEIWRAFAPAVLKNATITATLSQAVVSSLTVESFSGVNVSGTNGSGAIGAIASGHSAKGTPSASLVTTQNNSLVIGVGNDFDQAVARTLIAGQTLLHQDLTSTGDTYWVQQINAGTSLKGTKMTLGDTAPASDQFNLSICEIVPAAASTVDAPQLTLSATTLPFGSIADGTTKSLSLTLTSSGASPVTISAASLTGTGFSVTTSAATASGLPKTLAPGQTLVVPVVFAPKAAGAVTGKLTITSNSSTSATSTIALTGTGTAAATPKLTLSATTLPFGSLADGTTKSLSLTLTSSGTSSVTVSAASITGTGFSVTASGLPKTLTPGQTLAIPVVFAPKAAGAVSGKLTITSNSSTGTTSAITLTGTGTAAATPKLTLSATTLPFGSIADGTTKSLSLTLTSSGTSSVTVSAASITGTGFSVTASGLPKTLTPGQTLVVPVVFAPKSAGAVTGKLTITSNSTTGATSAITLTGTGTAAATPQLTLSATSLPFGSLADGTSKSLSLTLTSSGTSSVTVSAASITGTGFSLVAGSWPQTLTAGQSLTIQVKFAPTAAGAVTGKLTISSNSTTGATSAITLTGTGTAATSPKLGISATSLSFGTVTLDSSSMESVTLTSTGTSPVTISSAVITGARFSLASGTFPISLNPGATATLTIEFLPTAAGTSTGQLTINSNSTLGSTSTVALTGTGAAAATFSVTLSWSAPSASTDPIAGYHIYRAVAGSTTFALLNSTLDTQTSYVDSSVVGGTTYSYEAKSVDEDGVESTASNEFSVAIP
ncbi:choice-of-anchor D domain-containing protein [Acidicapsa ligni]|uniref:choice-of-anchor D domain-containing protein n=1 Tax=Acidicapsa ligni TaxID=542300 RepID=UPI0021E00F31|nr:choice-of-anchor D domain-containing protein [Acidicapsa ligni]